MSRSAALLIVLLAAITPASAQAPDASQRTPLRIAIANAGFEGCTSAPSDAAAAAYRTHLQTRLEKPVNLCGYKDAAAAGQALVGGEADLAITDPTNYVNIKAQTRAIAAPRFEPLVGRVMAVALALKTSGITKPDQLAGKRPIFISQLPASRAAPLQGLTDYGVAVEGFAPELITDNEDVGLAALRSGKGDALILTGGARQRLCRADDPKVVLCEDVVEVWRGRPTATQAFVVRNDMVEADRYQLVGIHIAIHKTNPAAFAYVQKLMPGAIMLDPTEASALVKGPR
jgi:ABC-type phosphate/phosphonate transport system substrate-binding protein